MERAAWLRDVRRSAEQRWDQQYAATYDQTAEPMTPTHRAFVSRVVEATPMDGTILDAPCGTGKYFDVIRSAGRTVVGVDQSAGMLEQARAKFPDVRLEKIGLQELPFEREFDGVICVDAMENVPPDDWPLVLANLRHALRPGGLLYLTVEEIDRAKVDGAYEDAQARGLPAVHGEYVGPGHGYHYYPERSRVAAWLSEANVEIVEDGFSPADGYGYYHLLLRPRQT